MTALAQEDEDGLLQDMGVLQRWRIARLREQLAVCLLALRRPVEAERAVERFLVSAERSAPGDVEPPDQLLARRALLPATLVERLEAVALAAGASSVEERGP